MGPVLVLGVPIFDMTLVVFSRLRRGLNPFTTPGTDHTSHRLVRLGYTQREAVMGLYLVGGILGLIALLVVESDRMAAYSILVLVAIAALIGIWRLERIPLTSKPPQ
jgi:UDP-GlcNAc:undecaprenyl-phosphate GlcNAc-1-phosphate transferase